MVALPSATFLTVGSPYNAAVQLLYKLPGKYRLIHTIVPKHNLVPPSHGTSEIILRASTDSQYEVELIQTTTVNIRTHYGHTAKIEKRAFRIKNGQWSMWAVDANAEPDVVKWKLTDLTLGEVGAPQQVGPDLVQKAELRGGPWQDDYGRNAMAMCVWVGKPPCCWQSTHQVDRQGPGPREVYSDEFLPVVEGGGPV